VYSKERTPTNVLRRGRFRFETRYSLCFQQAEGRMKRRPEVGDRGEMRFVVATEHTIDFCDDRMPVVLSTPSLIWNLEYAAVNALAPILESHEHCVGSQVDIQHLAPTSLGQQVVCVAKVINADGPLVMFQVEAHDEHELIARGLHQRSVIDVERFARRILKKMQA
jgi:predicted thioesterase